MQMDDIFLQHVHDYVMPYKVYFPIVWSTYSPKSNSIISDLLHKDIWKFSNYAGTWRIYGYGMFAIHMNDFVRFKMSEKFEGWGGEDNDFFKRVTTDKRMSIVRKNEKGLIHLWHEKDCSHLVTDRSKLRACLGSIATYTSSNLGWMLMYEKRVQHDKILIVTPICLKYLDRVISILKTWGKNLPKNIQLAFFVTKSEFDEAKRILPDANFMVGDVDASEYPPVRKNVKMFETAYAEKDFDWILKVDDDTYVNIENLQTLVYSVRSSTRAFLGSRGYGRPSDKKFLDLEKPFCMGGPGYLLSKSTLAQVIPHFPECINETEKSQFKYKLWHSDVVISKCITKVTKLGCWESNGQSLLKYDLNMFKQHYTGYDPVYFSVTYHPLKSMEDMIEYHNHVTSSHIKTK